MAFIRIFLFVGFVLFLGTVLAGCGNPMELREPRVKLPDSGDGLPAVEIAQIQLIGVTEARLGSCVEIHLQAFDSEGHRAVVSEEFMVALDSHSDGDFFATPSCANPFGLGVVSQLPIIAGNWEREIYFKAYEAGSVELIASTSRLRAKASLTILASIP